jgi:hypothetical protein
MYNIFMRHASARLRLCPKSPNTAFMEKTSETLPKKIAPIPAQPKPADECGGNDKPEPTRYGDWEIGGKCVDF